MRIPVTRFILLLLLFAGGLCLAGANAPDTSSTQAQNSSAALQEGEAQLKSKAQSGDPAAQFILGRQYEHDGNYQEAMEWYRKAADQNYSLAQSALGSLYQGGRGVPHNFGEALRWYRSAVAQNDPIAENNLALMYSRGEGVSADTDQAAKLFQQSAEQGWPAGQANLAYLYSSKDLPKAYMWCALALAGGAQVCKRLLTEISPGMLPADMEKANNQAIAWFAERIGQVTPRGGLDLHLDKVGVRMGDLYLQGEGVQQSASWAVRWYRQLAQHGTPLAQTRLADMYFTGHGVAKDPEEAISLFQKAANQDDVDAQIRLAYCYQSGIGVSRDEGRAMQLYKKAAKAGNVTALNNLAWLYATAEDRSLRNPAKGLEYASEAAKVTKEKDPRVLDTLAAVYSANGQLQDAADAEEKALALKPDDPSYRERLANYKHALSKPAQNP